jgi:hypothetical protein
MQGWHSNSGVQRYTAFLSELGVDPSAPSAVALGFSGPSSKQIRAFWEDLRGNPDARRLKEKILPRCDLTNLVPFAILSVHNGVEGQFVEAKKKRGKNLKSALRNRIRKTEAQLRSSKIIDPFNQRESQLSNDKQVLARVEAAFDTRRLGLASNWSLLLVLFEYLQFKSGVRVFPRDLGSLVRAAYAASGNHRNLDPDLLIRNVRRYAKRHPNWQPSGPVSARLIERKLLDS